METQVDGQVRQLIRNWIEKLGRDTAQTPTDWSICGSFPIIAVDFGL